MNILKSAVGLVAFSLQHGADLRVARKGIERLTLPQQVRVWQDRAAAVMSPAEFEATEKAAEAARGETGGRGELLCWWRSTKDFGGARLASSGTGHAGVAVGGTRNCVENATPAAGPLFGLDRTVAAFRGGAR